MIFYTSTINKWQNLLLKNDLKDIVIKTLSWMVIHKKAVIHSFVIMPNHVHILWTPLDSDYDLSASMKSYTGSMFRKYLESNNPKLLENYVSTQQDRLYHFWKRRSYSMEICSRRIAAQKAAYIHANPLQDKWNLVEYEEDYFYSSANYYWNEDKYFEFLSRYEDWI